MTEQQEEYVRCAKVNLENLALAVPGLAEHPYYQIVQMQLDLVLGPEG